MTEKSRIVISWKVKGMLKNEKCTTKITKLNIVESVIKWKRKRKEKRRIKKKKISNKAYVLPHFHNHYLKPHILQQTLSSPVCWANHCVTNIFFGEGKMHVRIYLVLTLLLYYEYKKKITALNLLMHRKNNILKGVFSNF